MMSLGTLLIKHGWITKQQLGLAISKQREIGGRLGTCLLEMGAIPEEFLDRSLAEQQGVPCAAAEDLSDIPEKTCRLLPAPIAIRYRAVPFRATHSEVEIAMLEVDNLWLQDELSFIVGRRLNIYIANEARVVEALAKYYRAPCSERFVKLLDRLNQNLVEDQEVQPHPESRLVSSESAPSAEAESPAAVPQPVDQQSAFESPPPEPEAAVQPPPAEARSSIPLSDQDLASLETEALDEAATATGPSPEEMYSRDLSADKVLRIDEAEVALATVSEPDEVGKILLGVLSQEFIRVILFKATPSSVKSWLAHGPGLDEERFASFRVPFDQPSIFFNLREGGSFFLGVLPAMPPHLELAACWHKDLSDECAIFPIRLRERLVAMVYGDRGPLGLADLDLEMIRGLAASASRAFERCILEQKRKRNHGVPTE